MRKQPLGMPNIFSCFLVLFSKIFVKNFTEIYMQLLYIIIIIIIIIMKDSIYV